MTVRDIYFTDTLLDEKSGKNEYHNVLIYDMLFNFLIGTKPLRIRFNKIDGFVKIYDEIRYLVLYCYERYNASFDRTRYIISKKA